MPEPKRRGRPIVPNSLRQRAAAAGLPYGVVRHRLRWSWPMAIALSAPIGTRYWRPPGPATSE